MKVLLINPTGGYPHEYPPVGLLSIASVLHNQGHQIGFFDEGATSKQNISLRDYVNNFKPQACGLAVYTTNLRAAFKTISMIKQAFPECVIFTGGPHATALPERTLFECKDIDYLVCGEGEAAAQELIEALESGGDILKARGLYYRKGGDILNTGVRELIKDLDSIPFPMYGLLKDFEYKLDDIRLTNKVATIMTSRGCPYDCIFCAAKCVWGRGFRRRSPENVIKEILWLRDSYGYREFYFMDDLFAVNKVWLDKFYELLKENHIKAPWKCLGRVDILSQEEYKRMAENGCYVIQFGVESGDDAILKSINKNITTLQVRKAFYDARNAGLNTYAFFMFGHPEDTKYTVIKTINFAKMLNPDFVSFFCLVPFPGTGVYKYVPEEEKYDWQRINYSGWGRSFTPISICKVKARELLKFEAIAYVNFYLSVFYVIKNIILSKARYKLIKIKIRAVLIQFKLLAEYIIKGQWDGSYKRIDLSRMNTDAFAYIWKDWARKKDYAAEIGSHVKVRRKFLGLLEKYIKAANADKVLEVGCGTAIDSYCLAKAHKEVNFWATDNSIEAISVAKRIGLAIGSIVNLAAGDLGALPFKDGYFDLIFSQGVMEHFQSPMPYIKEQLRVLKSNGFLVIDVPQKFNPYTIFKHRRMRKGVWEYGWETEYSVREMRKWAGSLGLKIADIRGYGWGYPNDYGFGFMAFLFEKLSRGNNRIISRLSSFPLSFIGLLEDRFGEYFMQNIAVVYQKI